MNFVKAETLVQEITADGKVRDIVTARVKTQAERETEQREETLRNLPEFKRDRGEGKGLAEQIQEKEGQAAEEEKAAVKEYNVHTIDEAEYEHYQHLEEREREKSRRLVAEEATEVASFESERKRLRQDAGDAPSQDVLSSIQQQARERAATRARAEPTAAARLRGRITVRARGDAGPGADDPPTQRPSIAAGEARGGPGGATAPAPGGGLLAGYASDSDA
uniref:FAM192A/Fyv6 N-terminal domain-containing protein n=1 Tax=Alexandrium monilatum TaxID=311494 RepID=A0A7S4UCJ0_9DINO|mmetsp:Transcript_92321/g.285203  ORF Transcript_92321/g.285203 Transcript_92321/m.285203 type:complete len:221 (-) Transcript_92321:28-690(-)